jgi:hypothetical protein
MVRLVYALMLATTLTGCGSSAPAPVGFVNQTQHSDADLWTLWRTAQKSVAESIDLNPLQRVGNNVPAETLPGDSRALRVQPHQLTVTAEPDVSSSALFAATGVYRKDPTGLIACPQPCNVRYATAYSRYQPPVTRYAASWEFAGDNFEVILEYEFENQILFVLGYDMQWR